MGNLFTESGVNTEGKPFVKLVWDGPDLRGQLTPDEARDLGQTMMAAAEAAESDALVFRLLRDRLGQPVEVIASILVEFRSMRDNL